MASFNDNGFPKVRGTCPFCGHSSLSLTSGGYITCSTRECRNPTGVTDLLVGEIHHVVSISGGSFAIRHPLRERIELEDLSECRLHRYMTAVSNLVVVIEDGTYRVCEAGGSEFSWTRLDQVQGSK